MPPGRHRNCADAELQDAVAQHAIDCKQKLADSTAGINDCLSSVSDDNVMHMEEAAVHEVKFSACRLQVIFKKCNTMHTQRCACL